MYEHVTRFVEELDGGRFNESEFTHALYNPPIVDYKYRETLDSCGLPNDKPWSAHAETLSLEATLALLTFVHRADHFVDGSLSKAANNGFLRRILVRLAKLEEEMRLSTIIGFWKDDQPYGFCSNWYPAGFEFLGTYFKTSEHWMMWQKARLMCDLDMEQKILDAETPAEAKALGRKVHGFDPKLWDDLCEQLVYYGVREKFLANPALASMLMATGSAVLCEATPPDKIWGIGMAVDHPTFNDPSTWDGKNLQGRVLMRVRTDLRLCGCELPPREEMMYRLLGSQVGDMSLLELSRVPVSRPAVLCWARYVQFFCKGLYDSPKDFLNKVQGTVREIDFVMNTNMGGGLPGIGWRELLVHLAFLQHTGQL